MPAIRCQSCGKPNPDFLEVCQYCDARLKPLTAPLTPPASGEPAPAAQSKDPVVRCQSCGKPNPANAETCQYCDARLKPLTAELPPLPVDKGNIVRCQSCGKPNPASVDTCQYCDARLTPVTDELKAANARPAATEWLVASREAATPDTPPEWLNAMPSASAGPPAQPAADLPDWLRSAEPPTSAETPATPTGMEEMPDWLRALRTSSPIVAAPPAQVAPIETEPNRDAPPRAEPEPAQPADDLPEWLRAMSTETPTAQPAESAPDWMSALREAVPAEPTEAEPAETEPAESQPALPADDVPEWLRAMSAPAAEPTAPTETPDWLSSIASAAPTAPTDDEPALPAADVPEWLRAMSAPAAEPSAPTETPDWLSSASSAAPTAPADDEPAAPAEDLPEWLSTMPAIEPTPTEAETTEAEPVILHPDEEDNSANDAWLQALPSTATPEWLGQIGAGPVDFEAPLDSKAADQPPAVPAEALPDWMTDLPPAAELPPQDSTPAPAAPEETPDWLRALRANAAPAEAAPQSEGPGLEQGALPTWLAAMRPVEVPSAHLSEEADTYEERVGVLAGMRGVLRAEPVVAQPHKSTVQVHKLTLTSAQTQQAKVLGDLVQEANQPQVAPKRRRSYLPVIERWLVTLILLAAVVTPLFILPPDFFPLPATIGQETLAAFTTIDSLTADKPALLVFDYDPAQSGELDPGALAVASHLARKGVPLVGLSLRVAGAAVADGVLEEAAASAAYAYGTHYVNLGYLPGGPIGVAQVVASLRAALPIDYRGQLAEVWRSPALNPINSLADFSAVIIITAAPDGAQRWLEQAQPRAPQVTFLAVVSAGAEPMVRPYAEGATPQLKGLVSGRIGAAKYEAQAGTQRASSEASTWQWDALGGGLLGAAGVLLIGNLIFGTVGFVRRRKR